MHLADLPPPPVPPPPLLVAMTWCEAAMAARMAEEWSRTVCGPYWAAVYALAVAEHARAVGRAAAAGDLGLALSGVERLVTRAHRQATS